MDDENVKSLDVRSFYGLPKRKKVNFEDVYESSTDDESDLLPGVSQPSYTVRNDDFVNNSSEEEDEGLLIEIEDENEEGSDDNGHETDPEEYQLLEGDGIESESESEIPLQQLRDRIGKKEWISQDNERGPATIPQFLGSPKVNANTDSVVDVFLSLFSDDIINNIVYQTNFYGQQNNRNVGLTKKELYTFLGINLVMSYIRYPRSRLYWSSDDGLRMNLIADAMSVNRFETILRNLHFVENPDGEPRRVKNNATPSKAKTKDEEDKLWKLRPFLDKLQTNFVQAMDPEEYQAVDEQVIPMKSRTSIKQYLPKKPKKWGIKCWVRADTGGYMYRFEIYQGAKNRVPVTSLGACADVVERVSDDIHHKNHKLFFDNLFCSIPLLESLRNNGLYGTGTLRSNRTQGADKKLPSDKIMKMQPRGTSYVVTKNNISITKWHDRAPMLVASSCAGKNPQDIASRYSKSERKMIEIDRPYAIKFYNKNMGGVDLHDQHLAMYPMRRKNRRWYIKVFMHFFDVAVINSFILFKRDGKTDKDFLEFKGTLAKMLINMGKTERPGVGRPRSRSTTPPTILKKKPIKQTSREIRLEPLGHWPKLQKVQNAMRCRSSACKRRTKYICKKCDQYLCPDCFEYYHSPAH